LLLQHRNLLLRIEPSDGPNVGLMPISQQVDNGRYESALPCCCVGCGRCRVAARLQNGRHERRA